MGILQRALNAVIPSRAAVERGFSTPSGSNVGSWLWGAGAGAGVPHEPFAGAWQRNVECANGAGPNILAYGAVYSCINIISSDVSRLPLRVLRLSEKGNREPHVNSPYFRLMLTPNGFQTMQQFLQHYMCSKLITGNTYVLLLRDSRGVVNEMYVLDPRRVQVLVTEEGDIYYRLAQDPVNGVDRELTVPARDILHDRMSPFWSPLVGVSPLFSAAVTAMMGARIQMNSEQFFANMSRTSGVLVTPNKMEAATAKRLQAEWEQNYSGKGLGRTAVLTNGLDYKPLGYVNANEATLVDQLRWSNENIGQIYRVPNHKLGGINKTTFRNAEQMAREYYNDCLAYHLESIENCFDRALGLSGTGTEIEFDLRSMFRMETDARYTAHHVALNAGFKSINEVRAEEDLPPVKGGEEPRVQMQNIPLSVDPLAASKQNKPASGAGISSDSSDATDTDTDTEDDPTDAPAKAGAAFENLYSGSGLAEGFDSLYNDKTFRGQLSLIFEKSLEGETETNNGA